MRPNNQPGIEFYINYQLILIFQDRLRQKGSRTGTSNGCRVNHILWWDSREYFVNLVTYLPQLQNRTVFAFVLRKDSVILHKSTTLAKMQLKQLWSSTLLFKKLSFISATFLYLISVFLSENKQQDLKRDAIIEIFKMKMKNASGQEPREALVPKIRYFLWNYLVNRGVGRILYLGVLLFKLQSQATIWNDYHLGQD